MKRLTGLPPQHGGNKQALAQQLGVDPRHVVDLSSAVSPFVYPLPAIPAAVLESLPVSSAALQAAAGRYYGVDPDWLLPVAGSQSAIQALPRLRSRSRVLVPVFGYEEHAYRWSREGHELVFYRNNADISAQLNNADIDVLVVINPNNPSGEVASLSQLESWCGQLQHGGWLIVDEAFIDADPGQSAARVLGLPGLIVLRSIGKFFGLPGLRLGFTLAEPGILKQLAVELGPWAVSAIAQWAGEILLDDRLWQQGIRPRLIQAGGELKRDVRHLIPAGECYGGTAFFSSVMLSTDQAGYWQQKLARRGILSRFYVGQPHSWLRIGLPGEGRLWPLLDGSR